MAHYFPPAIMNMFAPRPPLEFKPPLEKRKMPAYTGIAEYVARMKSTEVPIAPVLPTKAEVKAKTKAKKEKIFADKRKRQIAKFRAVDPKKPIEGRTKEAYKTLFVARLSYSVTADDLKSEFSYYGPVKHVVLVKDKLDQSRGYAFVEFEHSADLTEAYKDADGRKINGRRILVDVERGRTVKGWLPRRLGGGLGSTRAEVSHSTPAAGFASGGGYGGSSGGGYGYGPPQSYNNSYGAPSTGGYSTRVTPAERPGSDRPRPGLGASSSSSSYPPSSSYAPPAFSSRSSGAGYGAPPSSSSTRWEKGAGLDDGSVKRESDRSDRDRDRDRDGKSSSSRHSSSRHSSSRHRSSRSSRRSRSYSRSHSRSRSRDRSASRSRSHSPRRHSSSSRSGRSKSTADVKSDVKVEVGEVETGEVKVASSSSRDDRDGKESSSSRSGKSEKRKRSRSRDRDSRSRSRSRDHKSSRHR